MSRKFAPEDREQRVPDSNVELFFPRRPDIPRPARDLADMDRMHENVASGRLAEILFAIMSGDSER